jgi:hypothetical protein
MPFMGMIQMFTGLVARCALMSEVEIKTGICSWNPFRGKYCPGPPGRLSALSVFLCKSIFCGGFVWAHRALNRQKRRFPARAGVLYASNAFAAVHGQGATDRGFRGLT